MNADKHDDHILDSMHEDSMSESRFLLACGALAAFFVIYVFLTY